MTTPNGRAAFGLAELPPVQDAAHPDYRTLFGDRTDRCRSAATRSRTRTRASPSAEAASRAWRRRRVIRSDQTERQRCVGEEVLTLLVGDPRGDERDGEQRLLAQPQRPAGRLGELVVLVLVEVLGEQRDEVGVLVVEVVVHQPVGARAHRLPARSGRRRRQPTS